MSDSDLLEKEQNTGQHDDLGVPQEERDTEVAALENLYTGSPDKKKPSRFSRPQKVGLGVAGLLVGGTMAGSIIFMPILRLEAYMADIQRRAFAYTANAVEKRTQHLIGAYMITHITTLEGCGSKVSLECRKTYEKKGPAGRLFAQWRDARVEQKLIDRFNLKIETDTKPDPNPPHKYKVTIKDSLGHQIVLTDGDRQAGRFMGGDREAGRDLRLFLRQETKWYEVMQRKSIRGYLERKHGIKSWCLFACQGRDNIDSKYSNAKTRMKYKFTERFVYPFSGKYGLLLDCITRGSATGKCSSTAINDQPLDRSRLSEAEIRDITDRFEGGRGNTKISSYILEKFLQKFLTQQTTKTALSAIPIAGQIYLVATIADMWDKMNVFVEEKGFSKMAAGINSSQYLEYYAGMSSARDELKSGALGLDDVGALTSDFDGAETSKVFKAKNGSQTVTAFSLTGRAYAETEDYKCLNGKPIPDSELVCNEKKVSRTYAVEELKDNEIVSAMKPLLNTYGFCFGFGDVDVPLLGNKCLGLRIRDNVGPLITGINGLSDAILGPVIGGVMAVVNKVPGIGDILKTAMEYVGEFFKWILGEVFPLPLQADSPGRDKYDGLVAGSQVTAKSFAQGTPESAGTPSAGLGAAILTPAQQAAITEDQQQQFAYENGNSGLFNKFASLDNPDSLATRLVMSSPSTPSRGFEQVFSGFANIFTNMFGFMGFSTYSVSAGGGMAPQDAFGVPVYGYPVDSAVFEEDPDKFTPEYCADQKKAHEDSGKPDPNTGFIEYTVPDNCMLENATVEAAGSYFTND